MKWVRSIAARLPWVALGVGIGAVSVWVGRGPVVLFPPAPAASAPAESDSAPPVLVAMALAPPDPVRDRRVGAALALVRPGMTRREAEAVLGPPDLVRPQQFTGRWRTGPDGRQTYVDMAYVVYYCSPPDLPSGQHLMTVVYESPTPVPPDAKVFEVSGPHTPDD